MARVLVIDDNELNRDMLARRLGRKGHTVSQAADAEAGLEAATAAPPDVVLMDMSLPGMDGLEATRRLKASPPTARVPVILLTAHALESARASAVEAGCDGYDTKPVDLPRLLALIAKLTPHLPDPAPPPPPPPAIPLAEEAPPLPIEVVPPEPPPTEPAPIVVPPAVTGEINLPMFRHELRTPLNHIIMCVEELLDPATALPADLTAAVMDLRAIGETKIEIVDRIRPPADATQAELHTVVDRARFDLRPPASRVAELAERLADRATAIGLSSAAADLRVIAAAAGRLLEVLETGGHTPGGVTGLPEERPPTNATAAEVDPARVLVVDDDATNRQLFARALQRQGHTYGTAADGQAALDMLREQDFDVVLLDLMMPGLSGFDVLGRLKQDADRRHIPVIVISASDELSGVVQCLEAGAEDYLPKPCDPVLLRARLAGCLEKKRLRDRELEYLRQVQAVTAAAEAVEGGGYDLAPLAPVAERADALGTLARVFGRMTAEVKAREDRLKQEVMVLKVEIDEARKKAMVEQVTDNDYFRQLRSKVDVLRGRRGPVPPAGG